MYQDDMEMRFESGRNTLLEKRDEPYRSRPLHIIKQPPPGARSLELSGVLLFPLLVGP